MIKLEYPFKENDTLFDGKIHEIEPISLYETIIEGLYILEYMDDDKENKTILKRDGEKFVQINLTDSHVEVSEYFFQTCKRNKVDISILPELINCSMVEDFNDIIVNYFSDDNNSKKEIEKLSEEVFDLKTKINKIEDFYKDTESLYVVNLFIQYCSFKGLDINQTIDYLKENNFSDYSELVNANPEFIKFLQAMYNSRQIYMNSLIKQGINFDSDDIIELNKGQYDTCVTENNKIISKFYQTIDKNYKPEENSILYKTLGNKLNVNDKKDYPKKLYIIDGEGYNEITNGKIFILQNPYNLLEVLYNLSILAGTDNKLILSYWGIESDKSLDKKIEKIRQILKLYGVIGEIDFVVDRFLGIYCASVDINTKELKSELDYDDLLTKYDLKYKKIFDDKYYNQVRDEYIIDDMNSKKNEKGLK